MRYQDFHSHMNKPPIYLFGGTFNPPHQGHINLLLALQVQYHIDLITLLPNAISPLKLDKPPIANHHRINMLKLCISDYPQLCIDDFELYQPPPSYTVNTLKHFAQKHQVFFEDESKLPGRSAPTRNLCCSMSPSLELTPFLSLTSRTSFGT